MGANFGAYTDPSFIYGKKRKLSGPTPVLLVRVRGPALILKTETTTWMVEELSIEFDLRWKNYLWNGPLNASEIILKVVELKTTSHKP